MKNPKIKRILTLTITLTMLLSCEQNMEHNNINVPVQTETYFSINYEKEKIEKTIATGLAIAMKHQSVREFVKVNALKMFDGDYNFLFISNAASEIVFDVQGNKETTSFGSLIYHLATGLELSSQPDGYNRFIDDIQNYHPLVQIAIVQSDEIHPRSWDTSSEIPKVVYNSQSLFREKQMLPVYDMNGKYSEIDGKNAPSEIVLAVYENERTDFIKIDRPIAALRSSNIQKEIVSEINTFFTDEVNTYFLLQDYYDKKYEKDLEKIREPSNLRKNEVAETVETGGGGGGAGGGTSSCPRLNKEDQYDILYKVKFNGKSAFSRANEGDTFFEYSLEFKVILIFSQNAGNISTLEKFFAGRDGDFKNCFLSCNWIYKEINLPTIKWKRNVHGEFMKYQFYELDGGSTTTVSTNFTNLIIGDNGSTSTINSSISYQVQSGDDDLFSEFVEYCDNTEGGGSEYTTGAIQFIIKK